MKRTGALSTGTLSLKFMQRGAARTTGTSGEESTSSKPAVVELEKKKVYDEAEWDVGSAVRRAWGLSEAPEQKGPVEYESSYLPFLLPSVIAKLPPQSQDGRPPMQGRRKFEFGVEQVPNPAPPPELSDQAPERDEEDPDEIIAIASRTDHRIARKKGGAPPITSISNNSYRPPPRPVAAPRQTGPSTFLRPAGVDMPSVSAQNKRKIDEEAEAILADVILGGAPSSSKPKKKKKKQKVDATTGDE